MSESKDFPYISRIKSNLPTDLMPYLPLTLRLADRSFETTGLVDSGATVNVLPYQIGIELGANWESQPTLFQLGGNLANYESIGQVNFFTEFDICFFRSRQTFLVKPKI